MIRDDVVIKIGVVGGIFGLFAARTLNSNIFCVKDLNPLRMWNIPKTSGIQLLRSVYHGLPDVDVLMWTSPVGWAVDRAFARAKRLGKRTIAYWIGTDVYKCLNGIEKLPNLDNIDMHLAVGERLIKELAELGISARNLFPGTAISNEYANLPQDHAVLVNIPDSRAQFYGYDNIIRLIKDYPNTRFIVTRSEKPSLYDFSNVDFRGLLPPEEMERVFDEVTIVLRIPEHDSIGASLKDGLAKGKQVICNYDFPCTHLATTYKELCKQLEMIISKPPILNTEGHDYVMRELSEERTRELLTDYMNELLSD